MSTDRTIQNRLFDIAWVIFVATQLITLTAWYALNDSPLKVIAYKGSLGVSCALFAAVIIINLIKRVYPLKTFICYVLFAIISAVSWYFCRNTLLLASALLFMAAYELSARRVITLSAMITGTILAVTVILSELGIAENFLFDEAADRPRWGLGFSWATNAPTLLFFFILQYIFLRKAKMKIWEYVILEAVNVYMFIRTDTNLPFLLMTMLLIFFAVQGTFRNHWRALRHLKVLYYLAPFLICAFTVGLYLIVDLNSDTLTAIWNKINAALNNRLIYGRIGIMDYGFTLFGQQIEWIGNTIASDAPPGAYNYVDCSYIRILLDNGIVYLAAAIAVYTRMIVRAVKKSDFWMVFIALLVLIHSFTEPRLMELTFNVIPVLAFLKLGEEPVMYTGKSLGSVFTGEER